MKVAQIMTAPAVFISQSATFKQAAELMIHTAVGALPVLDDHDHRGPTSSRRPRS